MKKTIIWIVAVIIIIVALYFIFSGSSKPAVVDQTTVTTPTTPSNTATPSVSPTIVLPTNGPVAIIGQSVQGRAITAYHYGSGSTEILFIGGIHGGYEWNTSLVAYKLMDYLNSNPSVIPSNIKVTVIPVLNPDGLNMVVGTTSRNFTQADVSKDQKTVIAGRYNGNNVDLNRNFDCDWQAKGVWQSTPVSGGSAAFSEPESQAVQNYLQSNRPAAVVIWYSAAGGVYSSNCHNGVSKETNTITKAFATASGYPAHESFDFYATTGDMANWFAKNDIPAISVLLTNHTDTEWTKNLSGIKAILKYYSK